jgi:hypothetical protein
VEFSGPMIEILTILVSAMAQRIFGIGWRKQPG